MTDIASRTSCLEFTFTNTLLHFHVVPAIHWVVSKLTLSPFLDRRRVVSPRLPVACTMVPHAEVRHMGRAALYGARQER